MSPRAPRRPRVRMRTDPECPDFSSDAAREAGNPDAYIQIRMPLLQPDSSLRRLCPDQNGLTDMARWHPCAPEKSTCATIDDRVPLHQPDAALVAGNPDAYMQSRLRLVQPDGSLQRWCRTQNTLTTMAKWHPFAPGKSTCATADLKRPKAQTWNDCPTANLPSSSDVAPCLTYT